MNKIKTFRPRDVRLGSPGTDEDKADRESTSEVDTILSHPYPERPESRFKLKKKHLLFLSILTPPYFNTPTSLPFNNLKDFFKGNYNRHNS